jgi:hypothetical protein
VHEAAKPRKVEITSQDAKQISPGHIPEPTPAGSLPRASGTRAVRAGQPMPEAKPPAGPRDKRNPASRLPGIGAGRSSGRVRASGAPKARFTWPDQPGRPPFLALVITALRRLPSLAKGHRMPRMIAG